MSHFSGLHIVAAPLLAGVLLEATHTTGIITRRLAPILLPLRRWLLPALHVCVGVILVYATLAFLRPAFTEWVESGVTTMSRAWVSGNGMYPAHAPPGRLSVYPYGPLLFQIIGALYAASAGNAAVVKAAFIAGACLADFLLFLSLLRLGRNSAASALATEIFIVVAGVMGVMVKADGLLIGVAILACLASTLHGPRLHVWLMLCTLGGIAAAIKFHGPLYIAPAALECLWLWHGRRAWKIAGGALLATATALAPFFIPGTSFANYLYVLQVAAQDGWRPGIFISNIVFLCTCVGTVHLLVPDWAKDKAYRRKIACLLLFGVCISVVAAKDEAGPHHLIPLFPYLCAPLARGVEQRGSSRSWLFLLLFLLSFQPVSAVIGDVGKMATHWWSPAPLL